MSNQIRTVLYTGVTANLKIRVAQHKERKGSIFTSKYKCYYLMYFEQLETIEAAIKRETQIKRWNRNWKEDLIKSINPRYKDLFYEL